MLLRVAIVCRNRLRICVRACTRAPSQNPKTRTYVGGKFDRQQMNIPGDSFVAHAPHRTQRARACVLCAAELPWRRVMCTAELPWRRWPLAGLSRPRRRDARRVGLARSGQQQRRQRQVRAAVPRACSIPRIASGGVARRGVAHCYWHVPLAGPVIHGGLRLTRQRPLSAKRRQRSSRAACISPRGAARSAPRGGARAARAAAHPLRPRRSLRSAMAAARRVARPRSGRCGGALTRAQRSAR